MRVHAAFNVMMIVLLIHALNVDARSALNQRIFHTEINIGMKNVFSVQHARLHWLRNHSVRKMNACIVENALINSSHRVVINAIKYSGQAQKSLNIIHNNFTNTALRVLFVHNPLERNSLYQKIEKVIAYHVIKRLSAANAQDAHGLFLKVVLFTKVNHGIVSVSSVQTVTNHWLVRDLLHVTIVLIVQTVSRDYLPSNVLHAIAQLQVKAEHDIFHSKIATGTQIALNADDVIVR